MEQCVEMGVELDEFLTTCLTAMQKIAPELGL
jgi:predicted hydrolase (HD superfamily)